MFMKDGKPSEDFRMSADGKVIEQKVGSSFHPVYVRGECVDEGGNKLPKLVYVQGGVKNAPGKEGNHPGAKLATVKDLEKHGYTLAKSESPKKPEAPKAS